MKCLTYLTVAIIAVTMPQILHPVQDFDVIMEPRWDNLDRHEKTAEKFGGQWILAGSITFKKMAKEQVSIENIYLIWNGQTLDHLIASLYKKNPDKNFLPIEDNLVCDGLWNKAKQTLILNFEEETNLGPTTIFYLVLTVPKDMEQVLKTGSFHINSDCLPGPFKKCCDNDKQLSLAHNPQPINQQHNKTVH